MEVTFQKGKDNVFRVMDGKKLVGTMKQKDNHFLCYFKGRHTTTQNFNEVIRFFNGDFQSYYYRGNER